MDIEAEIKKLYQLHKTSGLFDDSFENVIYKLTNAYDYFFLEDLRNGRTGRPYLSLNENKNFDRLRQAYRACVKFVNEDCEHGDFKSQISLPDIRKYQKEMEETIEFNLIRNVVDRYRLGRFSAFDNSGVLTFKHQKSDRSYVYDAYSRNVADSIPGSKHSKDNIDVFNFNFKIAEIANNNPSFISKKLFKPTKSELKDLIGELLLYYLGELDLEIGELRAKNYYLGDYLLAYCYIVAIGMYKTAYLVSLRYDCDQVYQPSFIYPKQTLITDICETTGMTEEVANTVLSDMIYDYSFHKDKLTIYQPLFEIGNCVFGSTNMFFQGYVVDKIMKFFDIKGTNKKDLTLYHQYRAEIMNHRMAYNLPLMYRNLKVYENKVLKINDISKSEIDLVVCDEGSETVALIELKNYTPVDNELDAIKKEERINEAIRSRLAKDKLVVENIESFLRQNEIPLKYAKYKFRSLLITNTSVGGVGIKEYIKVLDEPLFYNLLSIHDGNLSKTIDSIESEKFYKMLESVISNKSTKNEYKGLKVEILYE